jgi:hypothetical protein
MAKKKPTPKPTPKPVPKPPLMGNPAYAADKYDQLDDSGLSGSQRFLAGAQISEPVNEWDRNPLADYQSNNELFNVAKKRGAAALVKFYNDLEARRMAAGGQYAKDTQALYEQNTMGRPVFGMSNTDAWEKAKAHTRFDRMFEAGGANPKGQYITSALNPDESRNRTRAVNAARRRAISKAAGKGN